MIHLVSALQPLQSTGVLEEVPIFCKEGGLNHALMQSVPNSSLEYIRAINLFLPINPFFSKKQKHLPSAGFVFHSSFLRNAKQRQEYLIPFKRISSDWHKKLWPTSRPPCSFIPCTAALSLSATPRCPQSTLTMLLWIFTTTTRCLIS